jgi:hypothetical protein
MSSFWQVSAHQSVYFIEHTLAAAMHQAQAEQTLPAIVMFLSANPMYK